MKFPRQIMVIGLLCTALASAKGPGVTASDDAGQNAYGSGWADPGGGTGFGSWKFQEKHADSDSYAGHFIADPNSNPEMATVAANGKAFGLYANGAEFETATAFRSLTTPMQVGDSFSFQMTNPVIEQKGTNDSPAAGAIGLTLRNGNAADSPDDYNKGARFEIINLKGVTNYQVYDGESNHDTGLAYSEQGIAVTVTLTGADSYDLEITRLADKKVTKLGGRKLGGTGAIESFCIFDRNGEKADGFFNDFLVRSGGK